MKKRKLSVGLVAGLLLVMVLMSPIAGLAGWTNYFPPSSHSRLALTVSLYGYGYSYVHDELVGGGNRVIDRIRIQGFAKATTGQVTNIKLSYTIEASTDQSGSHWYLTGGTGSYQWIDYSFWPDYEGADGIAKVSVKIEAWGGLGSYVIITSSVSGI
ncbi:MAG: hypothetical protein ACFFBD_00655 [Candidatus Hodarchaeota archaeon]